MRVLASTPVCARACAYGSYEATITGRVLLPHIGLHVHRQRPELGDRVHHLRVRVLARACEHARGCAFTSTYELGVSFSYLRNDDMQLAARNRPARVRIGSAHDGSVRVGDRRHPMIVTVGFVVVVLNRHAPVCPSTPRSYGYVHSCGRRILRPVRFGTAERPNPKPQR